MTTATLNTRRTFAPRFDGIVLNVDVDDVQAGFLPAFYEYTVRAGFTPPSRRPACWDFVKSGWYPTDKDAAVAMSRFSLANGYRDLEPLPGAVEGMKELSRLVRVRAITARGTHVGHDALATAREKDDTVRWLNNYGIVADELVFSKSKTDYACDLAIDDGPSHLERYAQVGTPYIIMDHPHNSDVDGPWRTDDWAQIVDIVSEFVHRHH